MKSLKIAVMGIFASALICGCGTKTVDKPLVAEGSVVAVGVRAPTKGKLKAVADTYNAKLWNSKSRDAREFVQFLTAAGFDQNTFKYEWLLLTSSKPVVKNGDLETVPDIALTVAIEHDLAKIATAIKAETKGDVALEEAKLGNQTIYKLAGKEWESNAAEAAKVNADICFASIDGKLLLVTSNEKAMQAQLDLYLTGKGQSAEFKDFALGQNDIIRFAFPNAGPAIVESVGRENLAELDGVMPNGADLVANLKTVQLLLTSADDATLDVQLVVDTAKNDDATMLANLWNATMLPVRAQMTKAAEFDPSSKLAADTLNGVSITSEGATLKASIKLSEKIIDEAIKEMTAVEGMYE